MNLTTENTNELIIGMALHSFIAITATLGNLLVLVTVWQDSSFRSPSATLLLSLSLSDLCVGVISEPVYIGLKVVRFKSHLSSCSLTNTNIIISTFLVGVTLFTLTAISVDRSSAIHLHLRYQNVVSEERAKIAVVSVWMASALHSLAWLQGTDAFIWVSLSSGTVCLGIFSIVWIKIYQVVRHHQAQIQDQFHAQSQQFNMARFRKSKKSLLSPLFYFCYFYGLRIKQF